MEDDGRRSQYLIKPPVTRKEVATMPFSCNKLGSTIH
jgi:hypothetical protein